jgi:DNA-binding transcriptional LysR family regulator
VAVPRAALSVQPIVEIYVIAELNFATFDLNLMRILDALLREGSTVQAGRRLNMSQSAVSGALARLRYALGDELFVRQGNRLVPTAYAKAIELPLREELDRLAVLFARSTAFDPATAEGTFRITASDFFAEMLMPPLADLLR